MAIQLDGRVRPGHDAILLDPRKRGEGNARRCYSATLEMGGIAMKKPVNKVALAVWILAAFVIVGEPVRGLCFSTD